MTRRPLPDLGPDFDGCATHPCRLTGVHSLVWGQCGQASESARPEPTVSFLRVRDADDGYRDIISESMTIPDLADRIERALRTVPIRLGPNALAMLQRGEQVILSGGEYAAMALAVAADLAEDPVAIASLPDDPEDDQPAKCKNCGQPWHKRHQCPTVPAADLLDDECARCDQDTAACLCDLLANGHPEDDDEPCDHMCECGYAGGLDHSSRGWCKQCDCEQDTGHYPSECPAAPVLSTAETARHAQSGIDTPGCDCGHDGMGEAWHANDCAWRRPAATAEEPQGDPAAELADLDHTLGIHQDYPQEESQL